MAFEANGIFLTDEQKDLPRGKDYTLGDSVSLLYCTGGTMTVLFNDKKYTVMPEHICCVLPNTYCGGNTFSDDFRFLMLRIKADLYQQIMLDNLHIEPHWWEKQKIMEANPCIHLDPYYRDLVRTYHHLLELCLRDENANTYRQTILQNTVQCVIMEILNFIDTAVNFSDTNGTQSVVRQTDYAFRRFLNLLQQNPYEREVQWFAQQMDITPKYLSEICKCRTGLTASEWITKVTLTNIKQKLLHTPNGIKEIAYEMHFPNSSFFCQYVRKHTGKSPMQIRHTHSMGDDKVQ